jgi:hypothetical protein
VTVDRANRIIEALGFELRYRVGPARRRTRKVPSIGRERCHP